MNNSLDSFEISTVRLKHIFKPVVVGYATTVTLMSWLFVIVVVVPGLFSGATAVNSDGEPVSLWMLVIGIGLGGPIIAVLQGIMLACMCGFGLSVFRRFF